MKNLLIIIIGAKYAVLIWNRQLKTYLCCLYNIVRYLRIYACHSHTKPVEAQRGMNNILPIIIILITNQLNH